MCSCSTSLINRIFLIHNPLRKLRICGVYSLGKNGRYVWLSVNFFCWPRSCAPLLSRPIATDKKGEKSTNSQRLYIRSGSNACSDNLRGGVTICLKEIECKGGRGLFEYVQNAPSRLVPHSHHPYDCGECRMRWRHVLFFVRSLSFALTYMPGSSRVQERFSMQA